MPTETLPDLYETLEKLEAEAELLQDSIDAVVAKIEITTTNAPRTDWDTFQKELEQEPATEVVTTNIATLPAWLIADIKAQEWYMSHSTGSDYELYEPLPTFEIVAPT